MRLPFYPPNQTQFSNHTPLSLAKNSFFFFRGYTASIHGTTRSETRLPAEHCGLSLLLRRPQLRRAVRHHRHRPWLNLRLRRLLLLLRKPHSHRPLPHLRRRRSVFRQELAPLRRTLRRYLPGPHRRGLPLPELPRSLHRHSLRRGRPRAERGRRHRLRRNLQETVAAANPPRRPPPTSVLRRRLRLRVFRQRRPGAVTSASRIRRRGLPHAPSRRLRSSPRGGERCLQLRLFP